MGDQAFVITTSFLFYSCFSHYEQVGLFFISVPKAEDSGVNLKITQGIELLPLGS